MSRAIPTIGATTPVHLSTERLAWKGSEANCATICDVRLRQRFTEAPRRGERIDVTAKHAVPHTALRAPATGRIVVYGPCVECEVDAVLERMAVFSRKARGGEWKGHAGKRRASKFAGSTVR